MNSICRAYRLIALSLAFLMLTTSVGFAVDMHFCQGQVQSFNFFGKAATCQEIGEVVAMKDCTHPKEASVQQKDCCSNKTFLFQSDQNQQVQTADYVVSQQVQQFVIAYLTVFFINDFSIENEAIPFNLYEPPNIAKDIPVLIQSFLL